MNPLMGKVKGGSEVTVLEAAGRPLCGPGLTTQLPTGPRRESRAQPDPVGGPDGREGMAGYEWSLFRISLESPVNHS